MGSSHRESFMSINLKKLNKQQKEAVTHKKGPALVISGAGSGKTTVLTYRCAYLVSQGVDPSSILLLTFTRKAAKEMLGRATNLIKQNVKVAGGTFHSFANFTLRQHADKIGYGRDFSIIDSSDAKDLIKLVRDLLPSAKNKYFPQKAKLANIISKASNTDRSVAEVIHTEFPKQESFAKEIQILAKEYHRYKKEKNLMDYDDLLLNLRKLLAKKKRVRDNLSKKYQYVMVDEFQDTNVVQSNIVKLLCSRHDNVMAVGDDAQAVYHFRGADLQNILSFPKLFPGCKIITIEQNYRSTQKILAFTNQVIGQATERYKKELFSTIEKGKKPELFVVGNVETEATFVADEIKKALKKGLRRSDIAVLFRNGYHSNRLELELTARRIPFVKYGGQQFIDKSHVKDFVSILKAGVFPADVVSWYRVLTMIPRIGPKTTAKIIDAVVSLGRYRALRKFRKSSFGGELKKLNAILSLTAQRRKPQDIFRHVVKYYKPIFQNKFGSDKDRIKDLVMLGEVLKGYKSMTTFLDNVSLDPPDPREKEHNRVVLSTLHSAKGLEWHTVFLICLREGDLPFVAALGNPQEVEEERRLFYVGATRAKEKLFLVVPVVGMDIGRGEPGEEGSASRFLSELPDLGSSVNVAEFGRKSMGVDPGILDELDDLIPF